MIFPTFIEFFNIKPQCNHSIFTANTVHLKPYSDEVYSFILPEGISAQIVRGVFVIDSKGNQYETTVSRTTMNGRVYINVSNILFDGWDMVCFKVINSEGNTLLYSSPIRVSSIDLDKTTYIKYRDNNWQFFGGIRLNMWFWHKKPFNENTAYYQVTREQSISVGSKREHRERYYLENVDVNVATALSDILTYPIVYFNGVRASSPELPEIEDLQASENFISTDVWVSKNYNDIDENNIDLSVYVIGNRQLNQMIGDGDNNIINSNINV